MSYWDMQAVKYTDNRSNVRSSQNKGITNQEATYAACDSVHSGCTKDIINRYLINALK
ncbi:MAG: hypothetical protein HUJ51_02280 [Eggerthellaceae bacterium]|nr:hypothetical protein [Eggerthellaceae bacterium]